ncbi:MAG TPA: hypothetical protein VGI33_14015 [Paenibacillus sp.]
MRKLKETHGTSSGKGHSQRPTKKNEPNLTDEVQPSPDNTNWISNGNTKVLNRKDVNQLDRDFSQIYW